MEKGPCSLRNRKLGHTTAWSFQARISPPFWETTSHAWLPRAEWGSPPCPPVRPGAIPLSGVYVLETTQGRHWRPSSRVSPVCPITVPPSSNGTRSFSEYPQEAGPHSQGGRAAKGLDAGPRGLGAPPQQHIRMASGVMACVPHGIPPRRGQHQIPKGPPPTEVETVPFRGAHGA